MKSIFLIMCINFCVFSSVDLLADESMGKLNATEITSVRTVSQALLKVRGQDRQRIEQEIKPMRDDLEELKKILVVSVAENDAVTNLTGGVANTAVTVKINTERNMSWSSLFAQFVGFWQEKKKWFETTKNHSLVEQQDIKYSESLQKARRIVSKRRATIENQLPSFWQVWKTPNENQVRSKEALASLEARLQSLESESTEVKRGKIKQLIDLLEQQKLVELHSPEPTITSITKHVSEQVK